MRSAICTLFEGHYHYGVGALVNSLVRSGFEGIVWVGYRGLLPAWAGSTPLALAHDLNVGSVTVRFIPLQTSSHFTNYKPHFMLSVLERESYADAIFYFDPDICIKCEWGFFERWVSCGVALAQEVVSSHMPSDHPFRAYFADYAERGGYSVFRKLNQFFNGGFIGVGRKHVHALEVWKQLVDRLPEAGIPLQTFTLGVPHHPMNTPDQALLNTMAMVVSEPLSTIGPEAMDFCPGGYIMSHATCSPKPWKRSYIRAAIMGVPPSRADRVYWHFADYPIAMFSRFELIIRRLKLKIASAIGRLIRRA